ncbi:MAG: response regulator [Treponema sp.]|jgi:signal transduction histidine kinase/CheY-like chemotaxis protein|nr:response regulator [Treponema sp.]
MPELRSIVKRIGATIAVYGQILLVFLAFTLMVILSYIYVRKMMLSRLEDVVNTSLDFMQVSIESDLAEPEKFLQSISQSIKNMIINDYSPDQIQKYIKEDINPNVIKYDKRMLSINRMYGYFEIFNGLEFINWEWKPSVDDNLRESPWYKAAVEANGKVVFTTPYFNARIRSYVLTYSRQIFDGDKSIAVIAIDVPIDKIIDYVIEMHVTEEGYGMLVDENFGIIAHPDVYMIGKPLRNVNSGMASYLANYLENDGEDIPKNTATNYKGMESIVFSRKLKTDWYVSLIAPVNKYYREVRRMGLVLTVLGMIMATVLSGILWRITNSKKKVEEENRQKSDFLAKMSHEIRTPISVILGITEIQLQDCNLQENIREALGRIYSSGVLLLGTINDILDFSKIEAGKMGLVPVKYYVSSMINDIVQLNKIKYESKPIEFILQVDENLPAELIGDELRIKQIMNNLLSNAFKYTDKGEVTLSVAAEQVRTGLSANAIIVFKVSDTGQGMTPEQIQKMFDEYSRFNMEVNRTTQGTGLGMNITRNLVYMMDGSISVKSAPGKGTEVTVKLPQRIEGSGVTIGKKIAENLQQFKMSSASQAEKAQIIYDPMPYGSVLVVDDMETNLYVAKGLLSPYELSIETADSGFEAIDKVKGGSVYDIIFMDHMMPKMDGIEATKILREMGYKGNIVALTANAIVGQDEMFMKNGFDGFISKPIDIRQLNITLINHIRDKQSPEVLEAAQKKKSKVDKKQTSVYEVQQINPQSAGFFVRDAEKAIHVLDNILQKNFNTESDIQLYIINVHAMKSALANIGEIELSESASRLEQAGRDKDLNLMTTETKNFLEALQAVIEKIKPKDDDDGNIEDTQEVLAYLREKLTDIKNACDMYDKKAIKNTLNELKEKTWSHKTKELMNSITDHLLHSEFDKVSSLADCYIKSILH